MPSRDPRELLADVVGQVCSGVSNPHGSIVSIDFGALGRREDDDPAAFPHGFRHLTILSPWRLQSEAEVLCDWNSSGGTGGTIESVLPILAGRKVISAIATPPAWDLIVKFSGDVQLVVFGDNDDDRDDAWFILGTDGQECGAVPRIRGLGDSS